MVLRLDAGTVDFEARLSQFLERRRESASEVDAEAARIIADIRERGDRALAEHTLRLDRTDFASVPMRVSPQEMRAALDGVAPDLRAALELARDRIAAHHMRQKPADCRYVDAIGAELGWQWRPVESVGLYVPGGTASYPSSVLMNAVPASVAGVRRIVMTVPAPQGRLNPLVLAAAELAGVQEVYRIGGAQAIAALAYGTETIRPVSKIVGPGNAWVAAAKRQVFGVVGIDMVAGPSEILVLADAGNDPAWIAADLLAQAEHDPAAQAILITDDPEFADAVAAAVERQLATLSRSTIARQSWEANGAIILVPDLFAAVPLVNRFAPEHLELAFAEAESFVPKVENAGAIFIGRHTPEVIGDYVGGSNHVLPTSRTARFSSGLSVLDFMKRSSLLKLGPDQLAVLGPAAVTLAEAEGLGAHARSVAIRMNSRQANRV